ncbi:SGNH/GDSL hydrolase family protein [Nitrosococcus wardiae]|uniref:GDSL family lipase n=1 Tax=Nitrosococcus wardiae TaxID=1814290 RepID=A0A4P7C5H3_9GAMM|nr:SGNH/GDSL hydrolase family protein [Nitrosococcus wardiae]QBQ56102.1 hypothetical protein E3U44_17485 [Nitrosococcus wardiae]
MKNLYSLKITLLALALCMPVEGKVSTAFPPEIFVFGDSLSDQGNVWLLTGCFTSQQVPSEEYFMGRFSNGPVYIEHMADLLDLIVEPIESVDCTQSILLGGWQPGNGNNFAYGGARTNGHRSGLELLGVVGQVNSFTVGLAASGGMIDPDTLFVLFAGANNIQDAIGAANDDREEAKTAMRTSTDDIIKKVSTAAKEIGDAIKDLAASGARIFLVPNGPDWGVVPAVIRLENGTETGVPLPGYRAFASGISAAFNQRLVAELDNVEAKLEQAGLKVLIIRFDFHNLLRNMVENPDLYGFENVTDRCFQGDDLTFTGGGTVCVNPDAYLFWDRVHPSAAAHAFIGNCFYKAIFPLVGQTKPGLSGPAQNDAPPQCAFLD